MVGKIKVKGKVVLKLFRNGELVETREGENLVVNTGLQHIADQLSSSPSQSPMSHMAVGTGTTAPSSSDTALQSEVGRVTLSGRSRSGSSIIYTATFGPRVGTGALTEAGIFNSSSGGVMLARETFSVINKGANDTLTIEWTISFSSS